MSNEYQYAKFATASTIRVIKLEEQRFHDNVACVIRHVEQSDFEYHALSYVWGDSTPKKQIYLGNSSDEFSPFPVHESLWRFLDWAWSQKLFDRWIWTDRICLNQEDADEMAQQIPRMGDIFYNAKQVMAWLGMSESEGDCVANHIKWPVTSAQRHSNEFRHQIPPQTLRAIQKAYGNKYWERVWMVQEVVSAKSIVVLIGNFETSIYTISGKCSLVGPERGDSVSKEDFPIEILLRLRSYGRKQRLTEVLGLINGRNFHCRRPQDRVYAGLGLLASRADGTSPVDFITIDYSRSYPEVLLDAILETQLVTAVCFNGMVSLLAPKSQERIQEPIFNLFKRDLENHQTSERHKELAGKVLEACDAFNIIFLLSGCLPGCQSYYYLLGSCLSDPDKPYLTARDNAAMLGLAIGLGIFHETAASVFEHWKTSRGPLISAKSPWRCSNHQSRKVVGFLRGKNASQAREEHLTGEEYLRGQMKGKYYIICWKPRQLMKACGQYSPDLPQSCDASTMTFEMPEVGFRVTLRHCSPEKQEYFQPLVIPQPPTIGCSCADVDISDETFVNDGCYGEMVLQFLGTETDRGREGSKRNGD